jgi:hypothetical protein
MELLILRAAWFTSDISLFFRPLLLPAPDPQDIRMLLVISNFNYLADVLIPSMLSQLEAAFGISVIEDRQVSQLSVEEIDHLPP